MLGLPASAGAPALAETGSLAVSQLLPPWTPKYDNFALFVKIMTQIFTQKITHFSESKYGQNHGQCSERLKGGSAEADFWYGENIDHIVEKSSK